jgi:hypothetical protein
MLTSSRPTNQSPDRGVNKINGLDAGNTGPHLTRAGYSPENYQKLIALKDKYDPANVFRFNHNIAPSNGAAKS